MPRIAKQRLRPSGSDKNRPTSKGAKMDAGAWRSAAECLRTLAHPLRLKMIQILLEGQPVTVCELADLCELTQPQTSDHLRLMQRCGFLTSERKGREVYYQVCEPHLGRIMSCIEQRFGSSTS